MDAQKKSQGIIHVEKENTLIGVIISILILIIGIQIWLLYGVLNNALNENNKFAWISFVGSTLLFMSGVFLLKNLPKRNIGTSATKEVESHYE